MVDLSSIQTQQRQHANTNIKDLTDILSFSFHSSNITISLKKGFEVMPVSDVVQKYHLRSSDTEEATETVVQEHIVLGETSEVHLQYIPKLGICRDISIENTAQYPVARGSNQRVKWSTY